MARVTREQKLDLECLYLFNRYVKFVHDNGVSIERLSRVFSVQSPTEKALMAIVASMTLIATEKIKSEPEPQ